MFSFLFVITSHIKELVSRKFSRLLRIICYVWKINKICENFFKTGRDKVMFRVYFGKLRKDDYKSTISFKTPTNIPWKNYLNLIYNI